jgi:hypothetical protein
MKKMSTLLLLCLFLIAAFALSGCESGYSESEMEAATQQAYDQGFEDGYYRGTQDQLEEDYDDLLIDGCSIRTISDHVYNEYGLTPNEAFMIVDEYEYDASHGGYTWSEYQNAIEAIFCTASIFPYDY